MADDVFELIEPKFPDQGGVMHSNKDQNYRFNTVNKFQDGTYRFIVATDIIARGLDIAGVSHVINFDTPDVPEDYIHRIGRTGRADRKGISITFTTEKEQAYKTPIEELMNYKIPVHPLPDHLEISTELTLDERPKRNTKEIIVKAPKREDVGAAFHEKSAKRQKVNVKVKHSDKMMAKYGRPLKRKPKK
jgi:ATP-dependent RNA helicase RhlE